ncbi:MAG: LPS assembly protein LptD [Proteobacteria bacterium]|nr:LPS assembly protein LptD [Pseudomonadota bacterium]MBU1716164.1 LPS assembly protein LptD [Pseudomonadota bacterium]
MLCFCLVFLVSFFPGLVWSQDVPAAPWEMTADRITGSKESGKVVAEGEVLLQRRQDKTAEPVTIKADWLSFDSVRKDVEARGNLSVVTDGDKIVAESATLNFAEQTGSLAGTTLFLDDNELYFSGRFLEKTGEKTYHFKDGRVTACRTEEERAAPWDIKCSEARVTLDGFAVLKNARFRIKSVPVLYVPYLVLPAKISRQSGFLFPELSNSERDGYGITAPFFVNLSASSDLTIYPGTLEKRGTSVGLEFRYMADYLSKGTFAANYLNDRTEDTAAGVADDDYRQDNYLRTRHDRYWIRGKADQYLSDDFAFRLDLDLVSDRDFLLEFRRGMIGYKQSDLDFNKNFYRGFQEESITSRESIAQLAKAWDATFLGLEARYVDDVLDEPSAVSVIHTLPRLTFSGRQFIPSSSVSVDWDSEYVNYWRQDGLGYNRFDFHPRLVAPLPFLGRVVEGAFSGGLRETFYEVETYGDYGGDGLPVAGKSGNRTAWDATANIATSLSRDFAVDFAGISGVSHTMRPNFKYSYLYAGNQDEWPDLDLVDRLVPENGLTYEFNNYFRVNGTTVGGESYDRNLGSLKIRQTFNFDEDRRTLTDSADQRRPLSDVSFDLELYPVASLYLRYQTALSVYGEGVSSYDLQARYANSRQDFLSLDYTYVPGQIRDLQVNLQVKLSEQLSVRYESVQSLLEDHTVTESVGLIYSPPCWAMEVEYSQDTDDRRLMVIFYLSGLGKALNVGTSNF